MAKVFKVLAYFTDSNDDYVDQEHFESELDKVVERHDFNMYIAEVHESEEFEWHDEVSINYLNATEEDYEEFFKEKKRGTNILKENNVGGYKYDVSIDIKSKDEILVTVTNKSTGEIKFKKTQSFFISAEQQGRAIARQIIDEWKMQELEPRVIKYESN